MGLGRLISLVLVLGAALGFAISSHLRSSDEPYSQGPVGPLAGELGGVPGAGMLTSDQLVEFWLVRVDGNPLDYISYTELGATFLRQARETGDVEGYSRAENALREALDLNPNYSSALGYLASVLYAKHDFHDALKTADRLSAANPSDAHALAVLGDARLELGQYGGAESAYDRLLNLTQTPPVFSRLARLRELQGRPGEAIELMRRAAAEADASLASQESRAWYHLQLGHLYYNTGDHGPAEAEYDRSLSAFPDYVHALAGLARVRAAGGALDEAIALYSRVVARYPIAEYVIALGDSYRAAGRPDEASKQYELVEAIDRLYKANGVNTDLQMALYFVDHGLRLDEALHQAFAEYERRGSIQAADVLAWALYKSGRYEEARDYSQEALRLDTQDALLLFHAGMIANELGDSEQARAYLERALAINPHFSILYQDEARTTLDELSAAAALAEVGG